MTAAPPPGAVTGAPRGDAPTHADGGGAGTLSRVLLAGCALVLAAAAGRIVLHDPTSLPVSGDQASFTYQALSLRGGDLAYDATDQARWLDLGWSEQPHGLFVQRRDDGWAFAKPLGYSVLLAPALAAAGARGISLVGAGLLLAYAGCWYGIGRLRWDRATAAIVATTATVASHAWFFGFPAHADLFVAVLVGLAALGATRVAFAPAGRGRHRQLTGSTSTHVAGHDRAPASHTTSTAIDVTGHGRAPASHTGSAATPDMGRHGEPAPPGRPVVAHDRSASLPANPGGGHTTAWLCLAAVATGLLVTEKLPALVALGPLLALAVARAPGRARAVALLAGAVVVGVSVLPYLYYSDGSSWSAYGGDRYYAIATTPWSGGTDADLTPWRTRDSLSPSFVLDRLADPDDELPSAALTYAVGRHTGVVTFAPIVPALGVAAAIAAWRRRRRPRSHLDADANSGARPGLVAGPPPENDHRGRAGTAGDPSPSSGPGGPRQADLAERRAGDGLTAAVATVGLVAYVALYLVVFTRNYFGGGQSVGNRYFLQVSLLVPVVAVSAGVTRHAARWCGAAATAWAVVVLGAQLRHPEEAFYRVERTSAAQRLLPFDGSQTHAWRFQCEPATCVPPPLEPLGDG